MQKMPGVDVVMAHQPQQGGAVASPVTLSQGGGLSLIERQMLLHVLAHQTTDVRKDACAGVV